MAAAVILTAVYGGADNLWPQVDQDIEVEWLCFTDDPSIHAPAPWQVIFDPPAYPHPNLAAKLHKLQPSVADHDVVWIDANMQVTRPSFAREALHARHDGIAVWRHPRRDCIYAEAEASLGAEGQDGKYAGLPIREQVESYRAEGHPEHAGLFACGTIAWDLSERSVLELGAAWLNECDRWSYQDQLSLPVVARRAAISPGVFPVPQIERRRRGWLENRWLRIHPHLR
jgi:hypothetical protein